jgi:2-hydroxymuconate-semialdehyde hydrolase
MGAPMAVNPALDHVWRCPRSRDDMRIAAGSLIHDKSLITDAYLDFRMNVIGVDKYPDYFDTMFNEPFETYIGASVLGDQVLSDVHVPVLMVHGRNDLPIPAEATSQILQTKLPAADLLLLHNCGHSVAMERRSAFLAAVFGHFQ